MARWWLVPAISGDEPPGIHPSVQALAGAGFAWSVVLLVATGLLLARQVAEFRDPFAPLSEDLAILLSTAWGTRWKSMVLAAGTTVVSFGVARFARVSWGWPVATVAVVALSAFPALTGHASSNSELAWLLVPADTAHVLAAGTWIGGIGSLLYLDVVSRRMGAPGIVAPLPLLVRRFSPLAMISVAVLIATGTASSWAHLPSFGALLEPGYGRLLAVKLALVAGVLGMGALNWRGLTPRLDEHHGGRALRRAAALELTLGTIVLLVTAVLVRTSPTGP